MSRAGLTAIGGVVWGVVVLLMLLPIVLAAFSPLQGGREWVYVVGSLSGIVALSLLLIQPLLAAGFLPGITKFSEQRWHRGLGFCLMLCVALHIVGLYLASPDDMRDALLLVAPTPFSIYGAIALWSLVLTGALVVARRLMRRRQQLWRWLHNILALVVVVASVVHTWMIFGVMQTASKWLICVAVLLVTAVSLSYVRLTGGLRG